MAALLRTAALVVALAGLHAAPAWALTEQQLREALVDDVPEEAQFKPWRAVPGRTLVAWVDYRSMTTAKADGGATPSGPDVPDVVDLTVLVVQTSTGQVLQRYHEDKAFGSLALQFDRVELDTANYALVPGRPAFGVRLLAEHRGYVAESATVLRLLEPEGSALRRVLTLQTENHLATRDCGESHDIDRTVAIGRTATQGHAGRVVHEKRAAAPDESAHPDKCHPATRRGERTLTLRFDGTRYPDLPN